MAWVGRLCASLLLCESVTVPASAEEPARLKIALFAPHTEGNTYWPQVFGVLHAVAEDLEFDFLPYSFSVEDRFARQIEMLHLLRSESPPDGVMATVVIGHSRRLLQAAEAPGIPIVILGPLFPAELPTLGNKPRSTFASWKALLSWAEEEKGHALGKVLLENAEAAGAVASDGRVHVVGVGGDPSWFGTQLRQDGLERAVREHGRAVLDQVVPTKWTPSEAKTLTKKLLRRFPEASVVWAASDQLGAGAAEALTELGKTPGTDAFTGGLDLSDVGLELVLAGAFEATAASPILSYAQAAILLHDYLRGVDFAPELGTEIRFPTYVATPANARQYLRMSRCVQSIDFRQFSRALNPQRTHYDFSFDAFEAAASACLQE